MNSTRSSDRALKLGALALLLAAGASAQSAYVTISAPDSTVIAGASMALAADLTNLAGTPIDRSGLVWSSSNTDFGTVSSDGVVQGLLPGDITVTVTDNNTKASDSILLHIVPSAITLLPGSLELVIGAKASITGQAFDVHGKVIPGVQFQYQSGQPTVADVSADGSVKGIAEGFVSIQAGIAAASDNAALVATIRVHVLPAAAYRIKKLLSTETLSNTTVAAYTNISAAGPNSIAALATLANGGQAAVLIENGKPKTLAVTGKMLPNAGRMVMRMYGIAANSRGDVAIQVEYPTQWCTTSIILIPHGQPEQEIGSSGCYPYLSPRALAEDGSVIFANSDRIYRADAVNGAQLLFSIATQPALKERITSTNDLYPSRNGTFILNAYLSSGTHQYFYYDGKTLAPIYKDGDFVSPYTVTNLGTVVGSSDGKFYAAFNAPNVSGLMQVAPGPAQILLKSGDAVSGGTFNWLQGIADAGPGGILLGTDLALKTYNTWISVWKGSLTPITQMAGWGGLVAGAMLPSGTGIATAQLAGDTALPLRSFTPGADPAVILAPGQPFPDPVPPAVDWHYAPRGATGSTFPIRGPGDALLKLGSATPLLMGAGSPLPNKQLALWIGGTAANEAGDVLFTGGYATGSGVFRSRGSAFETLVDSSMTGSGPGGISFNWVDSYRGRYLALNNRGDAAVIATYNNAKRLIVFTSSGQQIIAQQGAGQFNNLQTVAIDDDGRVMFIATDSSNRGAAYFWGGGAVQKVVSVGDPGAFGLTINEVSNVAGAGHGFVIMIASGNYANRELRSFDGSKMTQVQSTDLSLFGGLTFSYYWMNECTLAGNGDAHCLAVTQDGGSGVFAHRASGSDLVVARTRDHFPDGEWMLMPLTVSSSASGDVYFTAYMYKDGNYFLALYQGTPQ